MRIIRELMIMTLREWEQMGLVVIHTSWHIGVFLPKLMRYFFPPLSLITAVTELNPPTHRFYNANMFSHRAISTHRSRWWCVCVCVCVCERERCAIGGWCTTASVCKYFTPSHHSYAWERFTSFPRFTCRWMCFVLFNIMQSWFRCEQVSK